MNLKTEFKNLIKTIVNDFEITIMNNKQIFFYFVILITPVFFTFVFQDTTIQSSYVGGSRPMGYQILGKGIFLNANAFLQYKLPAIPIAQCLILYLALLSFAKLIRRKVLLAAIILSFPSLLLVYLYGKAGITQPVKVFVQTMNFLITIQIFRHIIPITLKKSDLLKLLYYAFFLICGIKLVTDIILGWQLISTWFIFRSVQIYNFYGYFPIVYLFFIYFAYSAAKKEPFLMSRLFAIVILIVSILLIMQTHSRIIQAFLIFTPLIFFNKRLDSTIESRLYNIFVVCLACFSVFYLYMMYSSHDMFAAMQNQRSLLTRSSIISIFFNNLEYRDVIFPSISEARNIFSLKGRSFHSEHLELYSCLGLPFILFFYSYLSVEIKKVFIVDRYLGFLLIAIVFLGGSIQLNLLQSYSGILIGAILGSFLKLYDNNHISMNG